MKVIGLMGAIGCGKGAVADILINEFNYKSITMGDLVREETKKKGLALGRDNETKVSEELRSKDPQHFIKQAVSKIKESDWDNVVIDGIRLPLDVTTCKQAFPEMIFVLVKVEPKIRYERMKARGREGFPDTYDKFEKEEQGEINKFKLDETWRSASIVMNNEGSMDDLRTQVIEMLEDLGWI